MFFYKFFTITKLQGILEVDIIFDLYLWRRLPCSQSPIDYQTNYDWFMY